MRRAHSAKIRQKIFSPDEISRIFPSKFKKIRKISISGHCMHLIFKICQIVAGKNSMTSYILSRIFKISILAGFYYLDQLVSWTTRRTAPPPLLTKTSFATTSSKTSHPDAMALCLSAASEAILALRRYCTASLASVYSGNMPN